MARVVVVDHKGPPVRSCDSLGISKLPSSDGAQESAIEVEQSQPGALSMVVAGQNDHLVAMHSDVADGHVKIISIVQDITCGLDRGDDLQVGVKKDHRLVSVIRLGESIGPLSLLMHCTLREPLA